VLNAVRARRKWSTNKSLSQAALRCVVDHAGILRCRFASRASATVIDTPAQIAGHIKITTATLTPNGNAAKSANVITHLTARAIHVRAVSQANVLLNSSIAAGSINSAHANMIRSIPAAT
jgi:hypothetical protein